MRKIAVAIALIAVTASAASFSEHGRRRRASRPTRPSIIAVHDDFRSGARAWSADFCDYSPITGSMELDSGIRALPPELGIEGTGFFITGHNRSDDLFMFLKKKLTAADGIRPNQRYEISYRIVFASNAGGEHCAGIGGAPGFGVYLKAGGAGEEPSVILDSTNHYRLTVDKGNQSQGGPAATVARSIENGSTNCSGDAPFLSIETTHRHSYTVTSNDRGELWLLVGTDSAFEGKTSLYYQSIGAMIAPAP